LGLWSFKGFQSTSKQISWSAELENSRSGVDQWSTTSQHPMTDIYYGTPGFGALWTSKIRALGLWSFELRGSMGLRRISHLHTQKILNCESLNTSTSPPVMSSCHVTSTLWDFGDFFLPLDHEPFLSECQVSGLLHRLSCVLRDQWSR
jgi:hypothetical protein